MLIKDNIPYSVINYHINYLHPKVEKIFIKSVIDIELVEHRGFYISSNLQDFSVYDSYTFGFLISIKNGI